MMLAFGLLQAYVIKLESKERQNRTVVIGDVLAVLVMEYSTVQGINP